MKKVFLRSVSKNDFRCEFDFDKDWNSVKAIDEILIKLGDFHNGIGDLMYNGEPGAKKLISEFEDYVCNTRNDDYSIDVFLGRKKIILIINTKKDMQEEISKAVFEFAEFEDSESLDKSEEGDLKND